MYAQKTVKPNLRQLLLVSTLLVGSTLESIAGGIKIDCPTNDIEPQLTLTYSNDSADALAMTENNLNQNLFATLDQLPPDEFVIRGSGEVESLMPDLTALDKCIGEGLKNQKSTSQDADLLTYLTVNCRFDLLSTAKMQRTQIFVVVGTYPGEPNKASLQIDRNYLVPSAVTGKSLKIPQWPARECSVVQVP